MSPSPRSLSHTAPSPGRRNSFIVRLWQEDGAAFWRGSVTEATSGEILFFDNVAALADFLSRYSGLDIRP